MRIRAEMVSAALMGFVPGTVHAQDTIPTVRFENGQLKSKYFPVGTRFYLVGSTALATARADAVALELAEEKGASWVETSCWARAPEAAQAVDFRLPVERALKLERAYRVKLTFFSLTPDPLAVILARQAAEKIADRLIAEAHGTTEPLGFSPSLVRTSWTAAARAAQHERGVMFLDLSTDSRCPTAAVESLKLSDNDVSLIGRAALAELVLRRASAESSAAAKKLRALTTGQDYIGLAQKLRKDETLNAFLEGLEEDEPAASEAEQVADQIRLATISLTRPEEQLLNKLVESAIAVASQRARRDERRKVRDALQEGLATTSSLRGYFRSSGASIKSISWTEGARTGELKVGTSFAWGATVLGLFAEDDAMPAAGDADVDFNALIILRFHLDARDKRLPLQDMYASPRSRWALDIGAGVSGPQFRGQRQEPLAAGLFPTLGISWDVTPSWVVHLGAVFFRQPSTNPLNTTTGSGRLTSGLRAAPFLAVGFDFDLVNRLRGAIKQATP